jgi:hypothetical protein
MRELIAHPGLHFWVYQLKGKLTYTHRVPNLLPLKYELHRDEFKGMPEGEEEMYLQRHIDQGGYHVSFSAGFAEEISLVITRVDGQLDMDYHYEQPSGNILTEVIKQDFGPHNPGRALYIQRNTPPTTTLSTKEEGRTRYVLLDGFGFGE